MNTLKKFLRELTLRIRFLPVAAGSLFALLGSAECQAQPPAAFAKREIEGKVERITTAPLGEIDGAVLEDGTWVHWPPHMQDRFRAIVKEGDRIRVTGRNETGKRGEPRFETHSLTDLRNNTTVENPDFAFGPPAGGGGRGRKAPPPRSGDRPDAGADRAETREVEGRVERLTTAKRGEIDGAVLNDGTWVHWPPHLEDRFSTIVKAGDRLRVSGRNETGKEGELRFETRSLTNVETRSTVENPDFAFGGRAIAEGRREAARGSSTDRERRLRDLEDQIGRLQRELEGLRSAK